MEKSTGSENGTAEKAKDFLETKTSLFVESELIQKKGPALNSAGPFLILSLLRSRHRKTLG